MGSHRPLLVVGGKWSVRPSELEKSAAKGVMTDLPTYVAHDDRFPFEATLGGRMVHTLANAARLLFGGQRCCSRVRGFSYCNLSCLFHHSYSSDSSDLSSGMVIMVVPCTMREATNGLQEGGRFSIRTFLKLLSETGFHWSESL